MTTPNKFAVLLKPTEEQPALDRAAQYARVDPSISVVAVRVVNDYKEENVEQLTLKEKANFEMLKRKYASIQNFDFKVVFDKNVAEGFNAECKNDNCNFGSVSNFSN